MVESQIMNKNGSLLTCQWNIILRMRQDWFAFFFFLNWAKIYIQWKVQMLSKEIDEFLLINWWVLHLWIINTPVKIRNISITPESSFKPFSSQFLSCINNHCSDFWHSRLILHVFELCTVRSCSTYSIVPASLLKFSVMFLRLCQVVACICSCFLFAE